MSRDIGVTPYLLKLNPWLRELYHIVFWIAVAAVVAILVPQGRDVVRGLVEDLNFALDSATRNDAGGAVIWRVFCFVVATALSGVTAWFWCDVLLETKIGLIGLRGRLIPQPGVIRHFRRLIGLVPPGTAAIALFWATNDRSEGTFVLRFVANGGWGLLLLLVLLTVTAIGMYRLFRWRRLLRKRWSSPKAIRLPSYARKLSFPAWLQIEPQRLRIIDIWHCAASLLVALLLVILLWWPVFRTNFAQWAGPAALAFGAPTVLIPVLSVTILVARIIFLPALIFLLALAVLASAGGNLIVTGVMTIILIIYIFYFTRLPPCGKIITATCFAILGVLDYASPDMHRVRMLPASSSNAADTRPSLIKALDLWQARGKCSAGDDLHMALVVTAGGASRAAYWTGTVLGAFDEASGGRFADCLFAISSVSGGTLGAVAYAQLHSTIPDNTAFQPERQQQLLAFLASDFLGPAVGGLLYTDMLGRITPLLFDSRATALEESFEVAARRLLGTGGLMEQDFQEIWKNALYGALDRWVPLVLANGEHVETGKRIMTAPISKELDTLPSESSESRPWLDDSWDFYQLAPGSIRASTAITNSARFPLVSPPGTLMNAKIADHFTGHIVDGGYFENSGISTTIDLIRGIDLWWSTKRAAGNRGRLYLTIILIQNDPGEVSDGGTRGIGDAAPSQQTVGQRIGQVFGDISLPTLGLFNTREAHAVLAKDRLSQQIARPQTGPLILQPPFEISLPKFYSNRLLQQVSMSWLLSTKARSAINHMFMPDSEFATVKDEDLRLDRCSATSIKNRHNITAALLQMGVTQNDIWKDIVHGCPEADNN